METSTLAPGPKKEPDASASPDRIPGRLGRRIGVVLVVAAGISAGVYWMRHHSAEAAVSSGPRRGGTPIPVLADVATTGEIGVFLSGLGTVTPLSAVTVKSRVDGQLMKVNFTEGQLVKEGDLLAEIDARPYDVQVLQAEGQLTRDEALLKNARADLDRYKTLFDQKAIAQQLLAAQESSVAQYEGSIKSDRAQLETARLNQAYAHITAPVGGRVGLRQVDAGNMIRASDPNGVVTITQLQPITIVFTIPQDQLQPVLKKLNAGERLQVDAYDREQRVKLAQGYLLTTDNQIDPATGTLKCKAIFTNEDGTLFPNQFVNVRLLVETKKDVVLVPNASIQRGAQQSTFVYVVTDPSRDEKTGKPKEGSIAIRNIVIGTAEGESVEIKKGLQTGDVVVLEGVDKLQSGSKVSLRMRFEETAAAADSAGPIPAGAGKKKKEG